MTLKSLFDDKMIEKNMNQIIKSYFIFSVVSHILPAKQRKHFIYVLIYGGEKSLFFYLNFSLIVNFPRIIKK